MDPWWSGLERHPPHVGGKGLGNVQKGGIGERTLHCPSLFWPPRLQGVGSYLKFISRHRAWVATGQGEGFSDRVSPILNLTEPQAFNIGRGPYREEGQRFFTLYLVCNLQSFIPTAWYRKKDMEVYGGGLSRIQKTPLK